MVRDSYSREQALKPKDMPVRGHSCPHPRLPCRFVLKTLVLCACSKSADDRTSGRQCT